MPHGPVLSTTYDHMNGALPSAEGGWESWIADREGHLLDLRNRAQVKVPDSLLELSDAEQAQMQAQLNGFFDIVERMRAVDTTGVAPLYTPLSAVQDVTLRLRDDAVTESDAREANQASAPAVEDGLFLVPRVIE